MKDLCVKNFKSLLKQRIHKMKKYIYIHGMNNEYNQNDYTT